MISAVPKDVLCELTAMVSARVAVAVAKSGVLPGQLADELGLHPDEFRARLDGPALWSLTELLLLADALDAEPAVFFTEGARR
ncbi:hypothetical protein IU434_20060 [Nocardia farcinica]|uniref:hypothetical protein n=1 Tax=Nocardia farcinica TaxID=37329 RepID=UPI0018934181|nr:hypothetical protein [Nocardia farcinica]MBF6444321.1 hypothetical protein [Nocardia farcinica]